MAGEQFSLCWDNFHKNMSSGMHSLLESEDLVDVTLAIEGKYLKAHKMVLSVCSPYFRELFQMNPCKHPIVFMKDVSYTAMSDLLTFMYQGEVQVNQEQLTTFIKTAEALQIKGLTSDGNNESTEVPEEHTEKVTSKTQPVTIDLNDDEVISKPVQKTKKPASYPPVKRQRTSSPPRERPSSLTTLKTDTIMIDQSPQSTEQLIQFKMEPYEADQSDQGQMESYEENPDDNFGEDGVDDSHMDDSEYSMLKGEEEPQAGTSGDGMGESQDNTNLNSHSRRNDVPRYVVDGFVFHVNITKGKPPMRYLRCSEYSRLGCHARAVIPLNGTAKDIVTTSSHNHSPDYSAAEKILFLRELKDFLQAHQDCSSKEAYDMLSSLYPNVCREMPFETVRNKLNRWRRTFNSQEDIVLYDVSEKQHRYR